MGTEVAQGSRLDPEIISSLVIAGDISKLSMLQKVAYYNYRCQQAGLDPAAQPFSLLRLQGKETLYANASCAQQLCGIHKLTTTVMGRELTEGIYLVHARVTGADGRSSDNMGAVPTDGLKGEALANAMLKATTKAIRRTVLAHLGLGLLDETEVGSIPGAQAMPFTADPRGDLTEVDNTLRDKHVAAIKEVLEDDAEEAIIADNLRAYVAEYLQPFQELFIATADELQAQKIITKKGLRDYLKLGITK